jgi:2,4-dienoyl-CoA reductase-like NADH-dependent reductase (Old Yellow Enzyme family)
MTLLDAIDFGAIAAPNRVVMAPLTRGRATAEGVPTPIMATYYAQRAAAGLIISEATAISRQGHGWPHSPGLWSAAQVEGWKPVTDAVHAAGGRIVAQLWHMGRVAHPIQIGEQPVSASATTAPGNAHTREGKKPYEQARPLRLDEIPAIVETYAVAARNALRAGFDGVQLHGANGYLIDQFLRDNSNLRDDAYGGPVENRIRLLVEVMQALVAEAGAGRTGVRLSPNGNTQGVIDSDPEPLFTAAAAALDALGIAFLELRQPRPGTSFGDASQPPLSDAMRRVFSRPLILNSDYRVDDAEADLAAGRADAISFGRPFIANPDLVRRIATGAPFAPDQMATWYSPGPEGYTDYPALAEAA